MNPFGFWSKLGLSLMATLMLSLHSLFAAAQNPLLSNLHQFRLDNYVALNAYYQFSVSGDTETLNEIVAGINGASKTLKSISDDSGERLSDSGRSRLTENFDRFKKLMRQNIIDVRKDGYPDLRLVADMANQAKSLSSISQELYASASQSGETKTNESVESARAAAILMANMMSTYAARSTSAVSQTFQGAETDKALDEQAKELDQLLSQVMSTEMGAQVESLMRDVYSKWGFIRGSYINFNENNVSFVIDRYSQGILEGLQKVIVALAEESEKPDTNGQTNTG